MSASPNKAAAANAGSGGAASSNHTFVLNESALSAMWKQTSTQLDRSWDEIGMTSEERRAAIIGFGEKLSAIAGKFVQSAQLEKKGYQERIHITRNQIVDTCKRLNKIFLQDEYTKIDSNTTLRAQESQLQSKLNALNLIRDQHETKIREVLNELHLLWTKLGTAFEDGYEAVVHDISEQKVVAIQNKIVAANAEIVKRTGIVTERIKECAELIGELALTPQELSSAMDVKITNNDIAGVGVHCNSVSELENRLVSLKQMKSTRQQRIQSLAVDINALWTRLRVNASERNAFLSRHSGFTTTVIAACEAELDRLKTLKKAALRDLCIEAKNKLITRWDEAFVHPNERQNFKPAFADVFTDESLDSFEAEIVRIELRVTKMAPLLGLINERNAILKEDEYYMAIKANDEIDPSARYKRPGGFLLKEEKHRNVMNNRLPKLNDQLRTAITAWESENGPLLLHGQSYLAAINAGTVPTAPVSAGAASSGGAAAMTATAPVAAAAGAAASEKKAEKKESVRPSTAASAKKAGNKTPSKTAATKKAGVTTPTSTAKRPHTAIGSVKKTAAGGTSSATSTPVSTKKAKTTAPAERPVLGVLSFNDS